MEDGNDMQSLWWRRSQLLAVLLIVGVLLSGLTLRISRHVSHLQHGGDAALRPWMNVAYIARTYDVPHDVLYRALGLDPSTQDRRPLAAIAREQLVL